MNDNKVIPSRWYDCGKVLTRRDSCLGQLRSDLMDTFDCHLELQFELCDPNNRDDGLLAMIVQARRKIDGQISLESVEYYLRGWTEKCPDTLLDD